MNNIFKYEPVKRLIDVIFSSIGITLMFLPVLLIGFIIRYSSKGSFFHKAYRVGKDEKPFVMFKIRTMNGNAPVRSFESLNAPEKFYVRFGKTLRLSGIDELPQLYNVLKGDMSLVGPRPTLFDQTDLISLREKNNIYSVKPGLTGFAQINGRTKLTSALKVSLDKYYLDNISMKLDMVILFKTLPAILKDIRSAKDQKENLISDDKKVITEVS